MGADKALLEINGVPLVLRVAREIGKVCGSVTLVGDPGTYQIPGLAVVPDEFPGEGPLAGIEAALRCSAADWNLIVACDMPALDTAILEFLFTAAMAGPGAGFGADVALPRYENGQVEPLCGVYHRRCHSVIRAALTAGIRRVTDALQTLALIYIPVASTAPFVNLNTPEDLRKYQHG